MSDFDEYNEQLQRLQELLTALGDVLNDLTPADLDSWAEMKKQLPLQKPNENSLLSLRRKTAELKRMADTLIRILAGHE